MAMKIERNADHIGTVMLQRREIRRNGGQLVRLRHARFIFDPYPPLKHTGEK